VCDLPSEHQRRLGEDALRRSSARSGLSKASTERASCDRGRFSCGGARKEVPPAATKLGDWYAQSLAVGQQRHVLLISEHSRLPVLLPGRDLKHPAHNFPETLSALLCAPRLPRVVIVNEIAEMRTAVIATTQSRSLDGTLGEFAILLKVHLKDQANADLLAAALWLSRTWVAPLNNETPDTMTRRLL
jgi:hypothetical protein